MKKILINLMTYDWIAMPVLFVSMLTRFFVKEWDRVITLNESWAKFFREEPGSLFQMKGLYLVVGIVGVILGLAMLPGWLIMGTFYSIAIILLLYGVAVFLSIFIVKKRN